MELEDRIRDFVALDSQWDRPSHELTSEYRLIDEEVVDSLGIMRIVLFLERDLGVEMNDEDLVADNFATVGNIAAFVQSRREG